MVSRVQQALQTFQRALGLTPAQAAGFVGNLQQESGMGLNPLALGDNGASFGSAQHQGPRLVALRSFAKQRGTQPSDFPTQLAFIVHEAKTTEKDALDKIKAARTPAEAARAAVSFFRPGDPRTENRVRNAIRLAGGEIPETISTPSAPQGLLSLVGGQDRMANEPVGLLGSIASGSPLFDLGIGLLAASADQPLGKALGTAAQFASERGRSRLENQIVREKLLEGQRQRQAAQKIQGLLADPNFDPQSPEIIGLLGQLDPGGLAQGLLGRVFAKPSAVSEKIGAIESQIGRELTDEEILKMEGGGPNITIDNKLSEPIPITQLGKLQLPDGSTPPIGTTPQQARDMGARVVTADDAKQADARGRALAVVGELENLAFGSPEEPGIFVGIEPDAASRFGAAIDFLMDEWIEQDPRVSQFRGLSAGTLGSLIRALGEAGALSDGDVERARALLPQTFPFPDSEEAAREKLTTIRRILSRGVTNLNSGKTEESNIEATPEQPEEPSAATPGTGPSVARIKRMSVKDLQRLDPSQMSQEALEAASDRMFELMGPR